MPPPVVILVRPQEQGNVGAVARAMANMGLERLVIVEPGVEVGDVALARAVGARDVLLTCRRELDLPAALAPFRRVVGTTASRGRSLPEPPVVPRDLPGLLATDPPGTATALLFGPESSGLENDELALASPLVRVPCSPRQPTLNLAQAVLILAYELHVAELRVASLPEPAGEGGEADEEGAEPAATAGELEGLFAQLEPLLRAGGFARDDTFEGVLRDLRRLAARSRATSREVRILRGICRRLGHRLGG